jgi:hypothetical protein
MGMKRYMNRLIDKARGGVQEAVGKIGPLKKLTDALDTGGGPPAPPQKSMPVSPNKRKKIKPKTSFD